MIILGDTGMGKSTYVSNLCIMLRKHRIMYLSLENTWHLTYKRMCQIVQGYTENEVKKYHNELENVDNLYSLFDHIQFGHIPPDVDKLQETVAYQRPHIVVVDTTDELHVKNVHNDFERMNHIIVKLKDIATNQDCIVLAVHHVNKESAKNGIIDLHSAKGTSTVVQKADKVLTINGTENHTDRMIYSEKNRDGGKLKMMFEFDKKLMTFKNKNTPTVGDYS